MAEKTKPEIRFVGFEEPWDKRTLGEIGQTYNGLSGKSKNDFGHGEGLYVPYMNVFLHPISNLKQIEPIEIDVSQNEVREGDVFFTTSSEVPEEVGMSSIWLDNRKNVYLNSFCFGYRLKVNIDNYYLAFMLRSPVFRKRMVFLAQGISRYNISKTKVMGVNVSVPASITEQSKIGALFQNLDKLITLRQRKYDTLCNIKKALLDKMFPQDGAALPEIRFAGLDEPWVKRILGKDVADIVGGGTPSTSVSLYWNGTIDWYSPTEIGKDIYAISSEKKITELGLKKCSAKILPADKTILFTSRAGIGDMAILKRSAATNQGFQSLVLKDGYNTYFFYSMGFLIKRYAIKYSSGSTFLEISGKKLGIMEVQVPEENEQTKIGALFQNLGKLITLQQQELDKLKQLKKAFLEKMFV